MSGKEDDLDLVDKMLKKSGCANLHYKVQECIAETRDWRKCQSQVKEFRACIEKHSKEIKQ